MQEREPVQARQKSRFNMVVAIVAAAVVVAALAAAYFIFDRSYNANLDSLRQMAAEANADYAAGSPKAGATTRDEYDFYTDLAGRTDSLSQALQKLNGKYPMLLAKGSDDSLGITALRDKLQAMAPGLAKLKTCMDEDAAISSALSGILGQDAGQSSDYSGLSARNDALSAQLSGISLDGPMETSRVAFAAAVTKRGVALQYLLGDAAVSEELAALEADGKTAPADLKPKYQTLLKSNDALLAQAEGVDLALYGSAPMDLPKAIAGRKAVIDACIGYMGDLATVQSGVASFCADLGGGEAKAGKLSRKMAEYDAWIRQIKQLNDQLDAVNAKAQYRAIAVKRDIASLGMTAAGHTLLGYEKALAAASAAIASSNDIEKKIDELLADKKLDLPDKTNALIALVQSNDAVAASLPADAPEDLKAGLASLAAGCAERSHFLDAFMSYVEDQQIAAGYKDTAKAYTDLVKKYKDQAAYWAAIPGHEADAQYYGDQADKNQILADEQTAMMEDADKNAAAHKKDYTASRKKYTPLLDT